MDRGGWLSIFVLAPVVGWFSAHLVKFFLALIASGGKAPNINIFFKAGGMPSAHSAVMVTTLVVIAGREGVDSAVFGLAVAITAIVLYDAVNVRRSVGEQGDVLRKVAVHAKVEDRFFTAYGHTLLEVICGIIVGLLVGFGLLQIL